MYAPVYRLLWAQNNNNIISNNQNVVYYDDFLVKAKRLIGN